MPVKTDTRPKRLTKRAVKRAMAKNGLPKLNIVFYDETDSTNTRARLYAENCDKKAMKDTLFIARRQRTGRGRMGRQFLSRGESGLWMTLLRFDRVPETAVKDTTRAAVAVCRAVEEAAAAGSAVCRASIKWVNDVFLGGRKLCGILAEGGFSAKTAAHYSVIGIGINLYKIELAEEIKDIATDLYTETAVVTDRAELAARIIKDITKNGDSSVMEEYRERSFILGKRVLVTRGTESFEATASEIENDGALTVTLDGGQTERLTSGEVSIRQIPI